jgi:GT2 family glycosyltransferase
VQLEVELHDRRRETIDFLAPHSAFFTWGENYGRPDCQVPLPEGYDFKPTRAPVVLDLWQPNNWPAGPAFTTIGNWRQDRLRRDVTLRGELYTWSKHHEFLKVLDLPGRTGQEFELSLSGGSYDESDRQLLESKGWRLRDALTFSTDLDAYRSYLAGSRGEFTVAKDQNIRLRSGWFSERSAQYLASGRPVITQETGFSNVLPTGAGLFAFNNLDEAVDAITRVNANYERHCRSAADLARECFSFDVVLTRFLDDLGLKANTRLASQPGCSSQREKRDEVLKSQVNGYHPPSPFPLSLEITAASRWPTTLSVVTQRTVLGASLPAGADSRRVSIVIVTFNGLVFTRLALESLLANTDGPSYEVIAVDNGSTDGTPEYLRALARRHTQLRPVFNDHNRGFAAANNQGMALAIGNFFILLNNDTLVPKGWLAGLVRHLDDTTVGLVGPVTNRTGNEAQISAPYRTYGEFERFAAEQTRTHQGKRFDIRMVAMFCTALRREVYERVGPLDERFEIGLFEDDDYALRVRAAGYRVICAEDVFVHHFGQATLGRLTESGGYNALFEANRRRWEAKWFLPWQPYRRRTDQAYDELIERVRQLVRQTLPPDAVVAMVSKGDEALLDLDGRPAWHFPRTPDGVYAGHHPANSQEAIAHLEMLRASGVGYLVLPRTMYWWLEYYRTFRDYLERRFAVVARREDACVIFNLREPDMGSRANGYAGSAQDVAHT